MNKISVMILVLGLSGCQALPPRMPVEDFKHAVSEGQWARSRPYKESWAQELYWSQPTGRTTTIRTR